MDTIATSSLVAGRAARRLRVIVPAALAGVLLTLAYPPTGLWPLAWLAPGLLFSLMISAGAKRGAAAAFFFGLAVYGVGLHWMTELATPLWAILALIQASFFAVFGALCGFTLPRLSPAFRPVAFAAGWTIFEWTRGLGTYNFPWFNLATAHATPSALAALQLVSLTGQWGLSFCAALGGALIFEARRNDNPRHRLALSGAAMGVVLAVYGTGALLRAMEGRRPADPMVRVAIAQGAERRDGKTDVWTLYDDLTDRAAFEHPDVIFWPEGTVVGDSYGRQRLAQTARRVRIPLFVGVAEMSPDDRPLNRIRVFNADGAESGMYQKRRLVPFGEVYPMRRYLPGVYQSFGVNFDSYVEGAEPGLLDVPGVGRVGAIICYESVFPFLSRDTIHGGAQALAFVTSDQTFGTTSELPQHLQLAVLRAVETRRWVVRAAATGISAAIAPDGRVTAQLDAARRGVLVAQVGIRDDISPAMRLGDGLIAVFGVIVLIAVAQALRHRPQAASQGTSQAASQDATQTAS